MFCRLFPADQNAAVYLYISQTMSFSRLILSPGFFISKIGIFYGMWDHGYGNGIIT